MKRSRRPASSNIHPGSMLLPPGRFTDEDHECLHARMTLAAACGSLLDGTFPAWGLKW